MILPVVVYPSPVLRQKSVAVSAERLKSDSFQTMLGYLHDTATHHRAAGLAAIQVGVAERVLLALNTTSGKYVACINPEILGLGGEPACVQEGCLSFPGMTANVYRNPEAMVRWTGMDGELVERTVTGFEAQIFQHELKHLFGRLLIDELPKQYRADFLARYHSLQRKAR